jgi:hypothetical protein
VEAENDPLGYLRQEAQAILDEAGRAQVLGELAGLEKLYPPKANKYLAPNGVESKLNHAQWYAVRTSTFK